MQCLENFHAAASRQIQIQQQNIHALFPHEFTKILVIGGFPCNADINF